MLRAALLIGLVAAWVAATSAFAPALAPASSPAEGPPDAGELTRLLTEFLAGASRNDVAAHERFWADDLIYTSSSGRRMGKADILRDLRAAPPPQPEDPVTIYTAEDIRIRQQGDAAVVAFRLVGTTEQPDTTTVRRYLNTGTFLRRDGKWQAVAWQATVLPEPAAAEEER
jgi:ketosteroid isomerase-like protein